MKRLLRSSIFCMAQDKKSVREFLWPRAGQIIQHLLQIYMYPNIDATNHWGAEVYGFINKLPKLKHNNKYPSEKFILDNTWNIWNDAIIDMINSAIKEYGQPQQDVDKNVIADLIYKYFQWLANHLSIEGQITKSDMVAYIKQLGIMH